MAGNPPTDQRKGRLVVLGGSRGKPQGRGVVWLVVAGPGDPELMTVKALMAAGCISGERADGVVLEAEEEE